MNIQHNRALLRSRSNIWSGGSVKFWHSCCGGCSVHYDYDDFWMKSCYKANFWPGHRILKVKKKENDQNFARNPFLRVILHINRFQIQKILKKSKNSKNPKKQKNPNSKKISTNPKSEKKKNPTWGPIFESVCQSLRDVVETLLMWLWLRRIPTQYWLTMPREQSRAIWQCK